MRHLPEEQQWLRIVGTIALPAVPQLVLWLLVFVVQRVREKRAQR